MATYTDAFGHGATATVEAPAPRTIPTAVINATEIRLDVNPTPSSISQYISQMTGQSDQDLFRWSVEVLWILLLASVPFVFIKAVRQKRRNVAAKAREREWAASLRNLWLTPSWFTFFGLCDLYILGVLPKGPWKAKPDKSLKSWPEKRYLRRLIHMGIVPLYIQDGGLDTRREKAPELADEGIGIKLPKYVQSKRRAYFEFLVPQARGYSKPEYQWENPRTTPFKQFIHALLTNRHSYIVNVSASGTDFAIDSSHPANTRTSPLEVGATSCMEALIPFKSDRILQPAKGQAKQTIDEFMEPGFAPLLETKGCPVVRVEVPDYRKRKLDEWVYGMAQQCGLGMVWTEDSLHAHASQWILENNLELPPYLIPLDDRV
ncbi:hypothetical protein K458DRAFT_393559 [Lentithecium fluviatile CBS 122367]|uniref:Uncharacterized protein n=1 Tax=Lentithecium fluviatile CBS 122367 TaxID=1168545 RepID=A0A6G1INB9_9PLEO|nr:hypothetical protein K458DRAFT_393559 [Lentithecium fluviatile CBS 122367]